jgi:hypothetical protein
MKGDGGLSLPDTLSPTALARVGVGFLLLIAAVAVVGALLRAPIAAFSTALLAQLGGVGLFVALYVTDPIPGLGFQPVMFLAFTGGVSAVQVFLCAWAASLCASVSVYAFGRAFRGRPALVALLLRWRIGHWIQAYGARAIAVAAVAPVPFAVATFGAGVMGLSLRDLVLGASARGLKMGFTLGAIMAGWGVGA